MPDPSGPSIPPHYRHFWIDWSSGPAGASFWPFDLQEDHEPFVVCQSRERPDDPHAVYLGCRDGYVRTFRPSNETDGGYEIESYVGFGPIRAGGDDYNDGILTELTVTADENGGPVMWWVMRGATHEEAVKASPFQSSTTQAGRGYSQRPRMRGGSVFIVLGNGSSTRAWAFDSMTATFMPVGKQRLS